MPKTSDTPKLTENQKARKYGIPRWLKRYHARYRGDGVEAIVAAHLQNPVPTLDHGRDRAARGKA
jgi:hypothetical protein